MASPLAHPGWYIGPVGRGRGPRVPSPWRFPWLTCSTHHPTLYDDARDADAVRKRTVSNAMVGEAMVVAAAVAVLASGVLAVARAGIDRDLSIPIVSVWEFTHTADLGIPRDQGRHPAGHGLEPGRRALGGGAVGLVMLVGAVLVRTELSHLPLRFGLEHAYAWFLLAVGLVALVGGLLLPATNATSTSPPGRPGALIRRDEKEALTCGNLEIVRACDTFSVYDPNMCSDRSAPSIDDLLDVDPQAMTAAERSAWLLDADRTWSRLEATFLAVVRRVGCQRRLGTRRCSLRCRPAGVAVRHAPGHRQPGCRRRPQAA